jgi:hypothetical protein
MSDATRERLDELLVERAIEGLDAAEAAELERLLARYPAVDGDAFERVAASVSVALLDTDEPLPPALRDRILASAPAAGAAERPVERRPAPRPWAWGGWVAAAASLLVAIGIWNTGREAAPEERLQALLASDAAVVETAWATAGALEGTSIEGGVIWSPARQEGYMRFSGLPANDPDEQVYQLWIFDAARDSRYPVDGGVFDVPAGADPVVVPIRAKLPVDAVTLFAVTREPPGGVVVSSREGLVLVAEP